MGNVVFALSALGFKVFGALRAAEGSEVGVAALVSHQLAMCEEALLAGAAQKRPLACVDPLVAREAGELCEALLTVRALERLLAIVSQHVSVENLELCEAFAALCTGVWTLSGVDLSVLIQKPHMCEAFPTLAGKRPLTCMFHLVSLQV